MIGFLQGSIHSISGTSCIIVTGGVGYKVSPPLPFLLSLVQGGEASLYIHTHVREDQITLYGFSQEEELFVFEKLLSVSGIGPKSALSMLSVHSYASLASAIERGDRDSLSHTPGVGKKTVEKIILDLQGKLSHLLEKGVHEEEIEVKLALEALGYSSKEIHQSLTHIDTANKTTSAIIKEALKTLQ